MQATDRRAPFIALASAMLFGVSTPAAKLLIDQTSPWLLAGLLYLGSGIGLTLWLLLRRVRGTETREATLKAKDIPWLIGAIFFGGIAGPVLLLIGLATSSATSASLLLNLESVATLAIAWLVFRDHVDRWLFLGAACIVAGAVLLSWPGEAASFGLGSGMIAAACLCWGIDNNLTRKVSAADPVTITAIKGLAAGTTNIALAIALGAGTPELTTVGGALLLGFFSYGLSLVLFILALRGLGAARTGAYYGTAPFIGAMTAILFLGEPLTAMVVIAGLLMAAGVWLHLSERHAHEHLHEPLEHDHRHVHDEHHDHTHLPGDPPGEPHAHPHRHGRLVHAHSHWPDLHHRHDHAHR